MQEYRAIMGRKTVAQSNDLETILMEAKRIAQHTGLNPWKNRRNQAVLIYNNKTHCYIGVITDDSNGTRITTI